ncbi:MAG: glycosyltransferase [Candidatus Brocadia sp.]|nr:glycosyltransferase [Candidatus Brocadia sp.]
MLYLPKENSQIKVSAIVSTYNSERFIRCCLQGLIDQTLYKTGTLEIIVIDSGSQQNERTIVEEFQKYYDNIVYFHTEGRETIYEAWNRGIKVAKGEYITNANTDDRLKSTALEIFSNYLDTHPEIILIHADQQKVVDNEIIDTENLSEDNGNWQWPPFSRTALLFCTQVGSQPMWRRSLHDKYGYFDESLIIRGDQDFFIRISHEGKFHFIRKVLGTLHYSPSSVSHNIEISDKEQMYLFRKYTSRQHIAPFMGACVGGIPTEDQYQILINNLCCEFAVEAMNKRGIPFPINYIIELMPSVWNIGQHQQILFQNFMRMMKQFTTHEIFQSFSVKWDKNTLHKLLYTIEANPNLEFIQFPHTSKRACLADIKKPVVSIIIPVFNKLEYTEKCLKAIFANSPEKPSLYEVIIVDNASADGTKEFLNHIQNDVKIIINEKNMGFARACNQGSQKASADYLLFLNNDTEPKKGWLKPLFEILMRDDSVAAAGSKLLFPNETIQHAGVVIVDNKSLNDPLLATHIYMNDLANLPEANQSRTYQTLTAACLLIRKSAFNEVGGFDEGYWNGYEDVDLCFKLQEKGWKLVYQPESVVIHHESKSGPERFSKVSENIQRLHSKWIGKIKPDIIIREDGSTIITENNKIQCYHISNTISAGSLACKPQKLVSIIILTYNALKYTQQCVSSIQQHTNYPHEIIFVNNGSTDGTAAYLRKLVKEYPNSCSKHTGTGYKLIENQENKGFAAGNNQGVSVASGDYIMLLNNDVLVSDGWLESLVESLQMNENIGMVGPITNSISGRQMVRDIPYTEENGFHIFAQKIKRVYNGRLTPRYRIAGFAILMKKSLYEEVGGLDESFGTGNYEDDDLCLKVREKGYAIMVDESVFIHHYRSQTFIENKVDYRNNLSVNGAKFKKKWPNINYEELLELHGSLVDANANLVTQGQQALESGSINEAIELYLKALNTNPIDVAALCGIGLAYQMSGEMDNAIDVYKKAIELNGSDASIHNNLGVLFFKKNIYHGARICFEKALSIDAQYKEARQNLEKVSGMQKKNYL